VDLLDVAAAHQCALARRKGAWHHIQAGELPHEIALLTSREIEALTWVAHGKSALEIGKILGIAKRTVDEHVQNAARKLHASNRTQAVAIALRKHLITI
jgi:LuxR family quorum sensing-dependent transcriptional regulator